MDRFLLFFPIWTFWILIPTGIHFDHIVWFSIAWVLLQLSVMNFKSETEN